MLLTEVAQVSLKKFDSWSEMRNLRRALIQYIVQQSRFGPGEDERIERNEDVPRQKATNRLVPVYEG